jgi:2-hydroxycyclohexanecarboxyl-CoA dehydrogenase
MILDGRVAIITGAASGIGLATAELLAEHGADVILADINTEAGERAAQAIVGKGQSAIFCELDVTDADSIAAAKKAALAWKERVDIVVNVAGWGKIEPFVQNTQEFWDRVIDINLKGPISMARAFVEEMMAHGSGKIINISSDAGRVGSLGETVYAGAKGGVIAFTKSLARETAKSQVNINCICPGPTDTPLLEAVPQKHREAFVRVTPMRRLGKPSDIAHAVLYFAGPGSDFVTGQVLSVSGGLTMVD